MPVQLCACSLARTGDSPTAFARAPKRRHGALGHWADRGKCSTAKRATDGEVAIKSVTAVCGPRGEVSTATGQSAPRWPRELDHAPFSRPHQYVRPFIGPARTHSILLWDNCAVNHILRYAPARHTLRQGWGSTWRPNGVRSGNRRDEGVFDRRRRAARAPRPRCRGLWRHSSATMSRISEDEEGARQMRMRRHSRSIWGRRERSAMPVRTGPAKPWQAVRKSRGEAG